MKQIVKSMDISEDDVNAMLDAEIEKTRGALPGDWTVERMQKEKGVKSRERARIILYAVFEPLVEQGLYEKLSVSGSAGARKVAFRKVNGKADS